MTIRRALAALCFATGLCAGAPALAAGNTDCGDGGEVAYASCMLRLLGAPAAAHYVARGDEMIRVLVTKPNYIEPGIVIVEVVLPPSGDGKIVLRDPQSRGVSRTYRFAREAFETLRQKLLALHNAGAALHGGNAGAGRRCEIETICMHGAFGLVDIVLDGKQAAVALGFCETVDYTFVNDILDFAAALDPACAPLSDYVGWHAEGLRDCLLVHGDRAVAARAFVTAEKLSQWQARWKLDDDALAMMAPGARLRIAGQPAVTGGDAVAQRWHAMAGDDGENYRFRTDSATATGGRIVVRGVMRHDIPRGSDDVLSSRAAFVQIWRLTEDGEPRLVDWRVGRFAPFRHREYW